MQVLPETMERQRKKPARRGDQGEQPLPALRIFGHGGWFCALLVNSSSSKRHQLAAEQPLHGQTVRSGKACIRTVHNSTNHASSPGHAKLIRTPWYYQLAGLDDSVVPFCLKWAFSLFHTYRWQLNRTGGVAVNPSPHLTIWDLQSTVLAKQLRWSRHGTGPLSTVSSIIHAHLYWT